LDVVPVANSPLAALARTSGTDLVHVHDGRGVQVGALRSVLSHTPFVVTRRVLRIPTSSLATHWCYGRAAAIAAVSDAVATGMREYDRRLPVTTIHDCTPRLEANATGALDDACKGQSTLIEAVRMLGARAQDMVFLLIGNGKDEAMLRVRAADCPSVRMTGWVDNVADYYAMMDIFVFPSRYEALGSSILEAMSFGVPVIATTVGGIPEIVRDGVEGLLVAPDDAPAIADRVLRLAGDPELRRRLGAQARVRAQEYSARRMTLEYLDLYRSVTAVGHSVAA